MDSNQDLENNKQSTDGLSAGVDNEVKTVDKLEQENVMMNTAPKKKGSMMVLGMVLMAIAMICGIGFGVWSMMDAEAQKKELNSQISVLESQNNELQEETDKVLDDEEKVDVEVHGDYENPIIESDDTDTLYSLRFESSYLQGTGRVDISVVNGKISVCKIMEKDSDVSWREVEECNVDGINERIYKVIEFGQGQSSSENMIGFILESGKVAYFRLYDLASSNTVQIKGYLNIDKSVIDVLAIGVIERTSASGYGSTVFGYGSTVFVMSDGSYVKFDESMLNQ